MQSGRKQLLKQEQMKPDPACCLAPSANAVARDPASSSALTAAAALGQSAICSTLKLANAASHSGLGLGHSM